MNYTYVDGSGNKYKLANVTLTYTPMTPELSSSGTYSGGDPFTLELDKLDLIKLIGALELALWSEKDQTDKRTMGSGTIYKTIGEKSKRIYLKMRSDALKQINDLLKDIKARY